ncbi:PucR family transcriptional regulator [Nocardia caishijiensis]|uniref:PucR-like helix-turn-helix protein n=1 Tax=Nocardia caishijiensis TaxID=184756 RepID=A0ABQ6YIS2_9NOCA|nr:helix-turn-helix domain-containing protein [Nocardia caishijiensis]KAF0845356.1 PucR-like helix-turn-helix protein [Nocardia caishijiensis]
MAPRTPSGTVLLSRSAPVHTAQEPTIDRLVRTAFARSTGRNTLRPQQIRSIGRVCLELIAASGAAAATTDPLARLEHATVEWARDGIGVEEILHALHRCARIALELTGAAIDVVDLLDHATATVSGAYVRHTLELAGRTEHTKDALAQQIIAGTQSRAVARDCGVELADEYWVLALSIAGEPTNGPADGVDERVRARRALTRMRAELDRRCDGECLLTLSPRGGTALVPSHTDPDIDVLAAALTRAAGRQVTVAVVLADLDDVAEAAECAHELLEIVRRLGRAGGVHRFGDYALEYQLTRPGPARDHLETVLEPLAGHPELLETLRCHVANNLNRRRTATMLHLHTNSIDYRIKRIAELTGYDATRCADLWYLRSALVVSGLHDPAA